MTPQEAKNALKQINLKRVHPFYDWEEMLEVRDIAINALEKQIPKKPIKSEKFLRSKHTVKVAVCPNCNSSLGLCNYAKTTFKYCGDCGQTLDWGETE